MKQYEKILDIIKNPNKYGVKRNERLYKIICKLAVYQEVQTGYSDRNTKYILTYDVMFLLRKVGISCFHENIAPRGGASGERVYLSGKVKKDMKALNLSEKDVMEM